MNALRIGAIAKRHWWVLKRSPHRSFDIILWPIVDTLTFGSLAIAYQSNQTRAFYVLAGVVLWHVLYQAQIAVSAGFTSTSHFATWYKRIYGARPSEMRGGAGREPRGAPALPSQTEVNASEI